MHVMLFLAPAFSAGLLAYVLAPFAGRLALRVGAVDLPGPRKIHQRPMPRLGGVAVIAAISVVAAATYWLVPMSRTLPPRVCWGIALGLLSIVAISILDDIKALPATPKFAVHLAGAAVAVACGVSLNPDVHLFGRTITIGWLASPLSVLWLVGMTNAFNLVDGLDGLSAGLALIAASALAGVFVLANQPAMGAAALVLAGGVAGFLPYNLFPARMFFGDTGATAIGFCLAAFALRGGATLSAGFATLLPAFVLGLPIAETVISVVRRLIRRAGASDAGGVFQADRNHMHHRLLAMGIDHPHAVFILYGAGVMLAAGALASMFMTASESALLIVALLLAGFLGVHRLGYDEFAIIRNGAALRAYETPALNKSMFAVFVDVALVAVAALIAAALKADNWQLSASGAAALRMTALLAPLTVVVFWCMNLYRGTWKLAAVDDFVRLCCAVFIAACLGSAIRMVAAPAESSASLFAIWALVSAVLVIGSRASYQILEASRWRAAASGTPTLIYGAGRQGAMALRELTFDIESPLRPVAFIDDDPNKQGRLVNGLPVVGSMRTLTGTIQRFAARAVVVASDGLSPARLAEIGEQCESAGVSLLKLRVSFSSVAAAPQAMRLAPAAPAVDGLRDHRPAVSLQLEAACVPGTRVPIVGGQRCPACRSHALFRSRGTTVLDQLHKRVTGKRLHRCQKCGWRGWTQSLDVSLHYSLPLHVPTSDRMNAVFANHSRDKRAS